MAKYPEVTQRLQRQIDKVVPRGRLVSLADKPRWVTKRDGQVPRGVAESAVIDRRGGPQGAPGVSGR